MQSSGMWRRVGPVKAAFRENVSHPSSGWK
jgi:hypothetical protein